MRSASICRLAGPVLIAICWRFANPSVVAESDPPAAKSDTSAVAPDCSIAKLIDAVREAEKQFANLETVVRKRRTRPGGTVQLKNARNARRKVVTLPATHEDVVTRTVLQGNLFYSKTSISRKLDKSQAIHVERIAAFDGKNTRTVEIGGTVNVHDQKTRVIRTIPPHSWPLAIEIPFSDFLAGSGSTSDATGLPVDSLVRDNFRVPGRAIGTRILGEETIKGLSCIRLEFEQEESENGMRSLVRLWLAKDRHLIAAKEQVFSDSDTGKLPGRESKVEDWQEVKKNVWLPKRITFVTYELQPSKNRKESQRETFVVEKASLEPKNPPEFFSNVSSPAGLPVFTFKNGRLVGSFESPERPPADEAKLQQIAEQLRDEESHYNRLSIDALEVRTTHPLFGGINKTRTTKLHSLLWDDMAYTDARHETWRFDGSFRPMLWTEGFDGRTYRCYGRHPPPDKGGYSWVSSSNYFKRTGTLCPAMIRPHSALIPWAPSYWRLADLLWPTPGSLPAGLKSTVEYLGERHCGLSPCYVLEIRPATARANGNRCLLWLAKDRNLIPVRCEQYRPGQTLPFRLDEINAFHEPSPGIWYPAHETRYIFRQSIPPAVPESYLFVDQLWDYSVQTVSLDPAIPSGVFTQILVPEGIDVQYFDKSEKFIGKFAQTSDSVPEMPAGK